MSNIPSTKNLFGIVSPCSSCNNQRAVPDLQNNLPRCPRRAAMAYQAELQAAGLTTIQVAPLTLTGNEDNSSSTSTALQNPVYSSALNSVLVWVATIPDNGVIIDANGNVLSPGLLGSGFDTKYINCRELPITPKDNEASYRSKGAWSEGDQLHITITGDQQTIADSANTTLPIALDGFADKVNFSYSAPRVPVNRDYSVAGS
jgi:hypothetical protein